MSKRYVDEKLAHDLLTKVMNINKFESISMGFMIERENFISIAILPPQHTFEYLCYGEDDAEELELVSNKLSEILNELVHK